MTGARRAAYDTRDRALDFAAMASDLDLMGSGLEGVSLGRTEIALVDGQNGRLIYRGHDAERLAEEHSFEQVAYLLWHGGLPDEDQLAALHGRLVEGMTVPEPVRDAMRALLPDGFPMDVLRSGLSSWAALRRRAEGGDADDAIWALAAAAALVADIARIRAGQSTVDARPELSLVENFGQGVSVIEVLFVSHGCHNDTVGFGHNH